jgi:hypothetical protein
MKRVLTALSFIALAAALTACAARGPKPTADRICIQVEGLQQFETDYLQKKTSAWLSESGFTPSSTACEVTVKYVRFGDLQGGETISIFGKSGYWSLEGVANVTHNSQSVLEDKPINLRGYSAKQDLLDGLADELVGLASKRFQPKK